MWGDGLDDGCAGLEAVVAVGAAAFARAGALRPGRVGMRLADLQSWAKQVPEGGVQAPRGESRPGRGVDEEQTSADLKLADLAKVLDRDRRRGQRAAG